MNINDKPQTDNIGDISLPEGIKLELNRQEIARLLDHPENFRDEVKEALTK